MDYIQRYTAFLLYHIKDRYYHMIYQSWYRSDHLAKVVFVSFLRSKLIHFFIFIIIFIIISVLSLLF